MTLHEYIKEHPNEGKYLLYHKEYFATRKFLIEEIERIESSIQGTILQNDVSIKDELLSELKHRVEVLDEYFERLGQRINGKGCARILFEMEEQELLGDYQKVCLYYKGKNEPTDNELFADYERVWVQSHEDDVDFLVSSIEGFLCYGLWDFNEDDGVPMSLKGILFNRYCHWSYSHHGFKEWYKREYLK